MSEQKTSSTQNNNYPNTQKQQQTALKKTPLQGG